MTIEDEKLSEIDPSMLPTPEQKAEAVKELNEKIGQFEQQISDLCQAFGLDQEFLDGHQDQQLAQDFEKFLDINNLTGNLEERLPNKYLRLRDEDGEPDHFASHLLSDDHCVHVMQTTVKNVEASGAAKFTYHTNFFSNSEETTRFWTTLEERALIKPFVENGFGNFREVSKAIDGALHKAVIEGNEAQTVTERLKNYLGRTFAYLAMVAQARILYTIDRINDGSLHIEVPNPEQAIQVLDKDYEFSESDVAATKQKYLSSIGLMKNEPEEER